MSDPLEGLVVDDEAIDRNLLAEVLTPYAKLSRKTGKPIFTPEFSKLSESGKIVVFLLARQAAASLGLSTEKPEATPREISDSTGVKYGTAKPAVTSLAKRGFLASKDGKYWVAGHAMLRIREMIK